jgi:hypothetical protein
LETGRVWLDLAIGSVLVAIVLGAIVRWGFMWARRRSSF